MRRVLPALLAVGLLAPPALAWAHDPLDDVSGEEDLNAKRDEEKPVSQKKAKQEVEFAHELQERDETEFSLNQEKEEFLRDRAETKDVAEAQRRRNQIGGSGGGGGRQPRVAPPQPQPDPEPTRERATEPQATPGPKESTRGDVDPTDASDVKPEVSGEQDRPAPAPKKKKKH